MTAKIDNIDLSYSILKRSSSLLAISLIAGIFKPVFGVYISGLVDFVVAIPILLAGIFSIRGFILAIKGSQYEKVQVRKRFFGLLGNGFIAGILIMLILAIIVDISRILT